MDIALLCGWHLLHLVPCFNGVRRVATILCLEVAVQEIQFDVTVAQTPLHICCNTFRQLAHALAH